MKFKSIFKAFMLAAVSCGLGFATVACTEDGPGEEDVSYGTLQGSVQDETGSPLSDVNVTVQGVEGSVLTDASGAYVYSDVPVRTQLVTFSKDGYGTVGVTVQKSSFVDGVVEINASLPVVNAKISGIVLNGKTGQPFAGVTVSNGSKESVTDAQGNFLIDEITINNYSLTFSADGVKSITKTVTKDMFVNSTAELGEIYLGGDELLGSLTAEELKDADTWYYNEYRGGKGNGGGYVDWSVVYMSTLSYVGQWENQNEGCTLQIRNGDSDKSNPADLENFDSFLYGKKLITEDNKVLTIMCRTHNAETKHVRWGVRVLDITDPVNPASELIGGVRDFSNTNYENTSIDLSSYVGKEIIIAIGIFRAETGDYYNQFVMRKLSFAPSANSGDDYLSGTAVAGLEGWHMTQEMVRSTMPNGNTAFTGIPPTEFPSDGDGAKNYGGGYQCFRNTAQPHIIASWAYMYVNKDAEPQNKDGFTIKTRSDAGVNTLVPESYIYSKFSIEEGANRITFNIRNGADSYTFMKLAAITMDGTVTYIEPDADFSAVEASAADDGCWKFKNNQGNVGRPDQYASFTYDLSRFNGQDVMLCYGVFKGEENGDENKIIFYSIELK